MNKTAIKNFAIWARQKLISDITYKAGLIGITEKGIAQPLAQSTNDLQFFDIGTKNYADISGKEIAQRNALIAAIKNKERDTDYKTALQNVVEEVAYTWFNRLIAVRFMEVNDYLPSRIRVLSSENPAKLEPDFVTTPFETDLEFTPYEKDRVIQLKDENKLDELFRLLFIKQCNKLNTILPELFEKTDDYSELLLTISFTDKDGVVYHLTHDIEEDDFNVSKEGQVEIIGWLYQYYNTEPKQAVFDGLKKNIKITKEKIPAATQLFTPHWIVRYMVENSLGRLWLESKQVNGQAAPTAADFGWKYYVEEAEQEPEVLLRLKALRAENRVKSPEDIKLIDPCMGSGHILVYAFDVLMQIYESEGYAPRDAAKLILQKNLYGLDIDKRAYQLAYFSLMMKGRRHNRKLLNEEVSPQVYQPAGYQEGEEYGSLLKIDVLPEKPVEEEGQLTLGQASYETRLNTWNFQRLLHQKYDVVVTNPPYMGAKGINAQMSDFVKENYPDGRSDLFAAFIERGLAWIYPNGYSCMVTMQSWMFLSSFETLRRKILTMRTIKNLLHMENMVMGIAFGTAVANLYGSHIEDYKGQFNYMTMKDIDGDKPFAFPTAHKRNCSANIENFKKIPGSPVAYWVSENVLKGFESGKALQDIGQPRQGLATADNNRFLRLWYEVQSSRIGYGYDSLEAAKDSGLKWFPYNKGGEFRKWYGNNDFIVNWENDGNEIRNFGDDSGYIRSRAQNTQYYFKPAVSWSKISAGDIAFRYKPEGHIFDVAGTSVFADIKVLHYLQGFCNSIVALSYAKVLSPTLNYEVGHIANFPILTTNEDEVIELTKKNITLSATDWDSFETSWDFVRHPILQWQQFIATYHPGEYNHTIEESYQALFAHTIRQFAELKHNEEELNRIFIEIYGLQDELIPEVEDRNVTVHKIFDTKDDIPKAMRGSRYALTKEDVVKSLISYAVGCIFGRYSLDIEGLAYAGGEWDNTKYKSFIPDEDNCLPITDEEYFGDDIVGRFVEFIRTVYGTETLEENLDFIAAALGNKGNTSRDVIRNYFLNDFFKNHCQIYQKRPIYWMFDSGKQNGFKALIYMHRYNADTVGHIRVEYLHRVQRVYENEIIRMQETIDNSTNGRDVAAAEKRKEKLTKQLKEAKDYDAKIAHIALSRINIDLDDGVKVNYEKVQTGQDGKKIEILAKI